MLGHFAVRDPEPVHLLDGETLTRWRDAPELALVRAAAQAACRHRIPIRDGVLDVEAVVGEDTPTMEWVCLPPMWPCWCSRTAMCSKWSSATNSSKVVKSWSFQTSSIIRRPTAYFSW